MGAIGLAYKPCMPCATDAIAVRAVAAQLIKKGKHHLLQRSRFLIDQVSTTGRWRLLPCHADDTSFKLQEMFSQIDGSPIHWRPPKDYVADHCMPQREEIL